MKLCKPKSDDTKRNISLSHIGQIPWNKNLKGCYSIESLEKMRKAMLGNTNGRKNNKPS